MAQTDDLIDVVGGNSAAELRQYVERAERLIEERQGIQDDLKDVMQEARAVGFDPRTMREIIRLRKMETHTRQEREALREAYLAALGMI